MSRALPASTDIDNCYVTTNGSRQTIVAKLNALAGGYLTVGPGITAAGSSRADATALDTDYSINIIDDAVSGGGVILPEALEATIGQIVAIVRTDALEETISVYAPGATEIAGDPGVNGVSLSFLSTVKYLQLTTSRWIVW